MRAAGLFVAALALTLAPPAAANFPQHVDATVQPNGTVSETSSTVPKTADSATITVEPKARDRYDFFTAVESVMATRATRKQRVLFCIGLYRDFVRNDEEEVDITVEEPALRLLFLAACLELALQNRAASAHAAATSCPAVPISVPMKVSSTNGGYRITLDGTAKKPERRPLRVRCRRVGGAMKVKLRPRSRTRSLRSVVGRNLAIGFHNSADSPVRMRTTFNVR